MLILLITLSALAGPRTDAATEAVEQNKAAVTEAQTRSVAEREAEREAIHDEIVATRAKIGTHRDALSDIEDAHATLVRGCTDSPLVATWNKELELIRKETGELKNYAVGLVARARAIGDDNLTHRIPPLPPPLHDDIPAVPRRVCTTRPADLNAHADVSEDLGRLDTLLSQAEYITRKTTQANAR